ncbi:hypothetical protein VCJ71_00190 [Alteriqipengyuania sp. WL0013]|uniref:hypothetical protein n=1 Tax=Alteriqipengyuania sp. WL0013 TaxID=3110773 RepID=UPI002CB89FA5|nr:hypothetical protein [Alteriqipengyuania sp. WL0013]MEB3414473.1 hypothetical protein [Alteriqipengyuania sp. WL0013]
MRKGEALRIFREELAKTGHDSPHDFTVKDLKREEAARLEWWYSNEDDGAGDTPRNRAFFRAYSRIAADKNSVTVGTKLPAQGLKLEPKGRLWMDKYVVRKMHQLGFLNFTEKPQGMFEPVFEITSAGFERINE